MGIIITSVDEDEKDTFTKTDYFNKNVLLLRNITASSDIHFKTIGDFIPDW